MRTACERFKITIKPEKSLHPESPLTTITTNFWPYSYYTEIVLGLQDMAPIPTGTWRERALELERARALERELELELELERERELDRAIENMMEETLIQVPARWRAEFREPLLMQARLRWTGLEQPPSAERSLEDQQGLRLELEQNLERLRDRRQELDRDRKVREVCKDTLVWSEVLKGSFSQVAG